VQFHVFPPVSAVAAIIDGAPRCGKGGASLRGGPRHGRIAILLRASIAGANITRQVVEEKIMIPLKRGSRGDEVRRLQALLCLSGHDAKPIDGDFGSGTERALRLYQAAQGLPADGELRDEAYRQLGMDKPDPTTTPVPVIHRITVDLVARMFADAPRANVERNLPPVLAALKAAGLDDRDMVLMALGTIRAETARFEPISEMPSKYNSSPGGPHPFDLYDHRASLGNQGPPDGARYKGRGFIQLTGRANYRAYGERLGQPLEEDPELANVPRTAAQILAAFLADKRSGAKYALLGRDLVTARKLVNGGTHGIERFETAFVTGERLLSDLSQVA
jgi:putative chitinase